MRVLGCGGRVVLLGIGRGVSLVDRVLRMYRGRMVVRGAVGWGLGTRWTRLGVPIVSTQA